MWRHTLVLMSAVFAADVLIPRCSAQERSENQVLVVSEPTMAAVAKMQHAGFMVLERFDGSYLMLFPREMTAESAANLLQSAIAELRDRPPTPLDPCAVRDHYCGDK